MNFFSKTNKSETVNINLPWVEKYRPIIIKDILLELFIKEKIIKILENKNIPNMIITGEPGTGKTSTVLFLAKKLYNDFYNENVLELNASDDRGLSIINNTIYPFSKKKINLNTTNNEYPSHKLIIMDEADSITRKAQNLLSNIISENNNTRFIFICNDSSQIIESIQSKCMIIKYPKISYSNLFLKIEYICKEENINYTKDGIEALLFVSDNDIRQVINNLECIYYSFDILNIINIYKLIDKPKPVYISDILKECFNGNYSNTINIVKDLYNKGYTPNDILLTFMKYLFEYNNNLEEEYKLNIYKIISNNYIKINNGVDTLLQLCGCISKIFIYINKL
jgi:replication factor C subunit 2/4